MYVLIRNQPATLGLYVYMCVCLSTIAMHEIVQSKFGCHITVFFFLCLFSLCSLFTRHYNATTKTIGGHAKPEIAPHLRELEGVLAPRETHVPLQPVKIEANDEVDGLSNVCILLGRRRVGT